MLHLLFILVDIVVMYIWAFDGDNGDDIEKDYLFLILIIMLLLSSDGPFTLMSYGKVQYASCFSSTL